MPDRRILSLWFSRLGAERVLRRMRGDAPDALAIVGEDAGQQILTSLSAGAEAQGLVPGQPLRDALAICPQLVTRPENTPSDAHFLALLRHWAGKFSPWVGEEPPGGLMIDLTGAAHLHGGEAQVLALVARDCADLGLTVDAAIADTPGAAWALARYGTTAPRPRKAAGKSGAAGSAPQPPSPPRALIAPPGQLHQTLGPLPLAALRLEAATVAALGRLGLRRVSDIIGMPRAPLARRFGQLLIRRLDQALGVETEPVSPARPPLHFAVRLTLPDPIGLPEDISAAIDRLVPALSERLAERGRGARRLRLQLFRADHTMQEFDIGLARPSASAGDLRPLVLLRLPEIAPGFGIDMVRIEAVVTEEIRARQQGGALYAESEPPGGLGGGPEKGAEGKAFASLVSRLGVRIGLENITRLHPGESHVPEKSAITLPVAWSEPAGDWPALGAPRPLVIFAPEPVGAPEHPLPPARFRWRRRERTVASATGPERIAPEWWLDEPGWRSGTRDYWRVETADGERLWLFYAHGGAISGGWFCQGIFA